MQGRTHTAVGLAVAVTVMRPSNINELVLISGAAALGSIISDIDIDGSTANKQLAKGIGIGTIAAIFMALFSFANEINIIEYIKADTSLVRFISCLAVFLLMCVIGKITPHRSFTHSLIGLACFSIPVFIFNIQLGTAFLLGFISHLVLDTLNYKEIRILYPLKKGISFKQYRADGIVNSLLMWIGYGVYIALCCFFICLNRKDVNNLFIRGLLDMIPKMLSNLAMSSFFIAVLLSFFFSCLFYILGDIGYRVTQGLIKLAGDDRKTVNNIQKFTAAGVVVHELNHSIFAILTFSRITGGSLLERNNEGYYHGNVNVEFRGGFIIRGIQEFLVSSAPITLGFLEIFLMFIFCLQIPFIYIEIPVLILVIIFSFSILSSMAMSYADIKVYFRGMPILILLTYEMVRYVENLYIMF